MRMVKENEMEKKILIRNPWSLKGSVEQTQQKPLPMLFFVLSHRLQHQDV